MEVDLRSSNDIPVLKHDNDNLLYAAMLFVEAKDHLDKLSQSGSGSMIVSQLLPKAGGYQTIHPYTYAFDLLPFFRSERHKSSGSKSYKALVPANMVIGESWRWRPEHLDQEERDNVVRTAYKALEESEPGRAARECADYSYIKPLGVVLAHEGKNRVALFKERQPPHIPALVSEEDYPPPERIRIFELKHACLAVLDNERVEQISCLALIKPLMRAYGVSIEDKWPDDYPPLQRVLDAFDDVRFRHDYAEPVVNMRLVAVDEAAEEMEVEATLFDINGIRLPSLKFFLACLVSLFGLGILIKVTADWRDFQTLLIWGSGALTMLICVPLLPLFKCKVRHLKGQLRWSQLFDAKSKLLQQQEQ